MKNIYDVTEEFEKQLSRYTGSKYAVTLDNASNAIFLALYYEKNIIYNIKCSFVDQLKPLPLNSNHHNSIYKYFLCLIFG